MSWDVTVRDYGDKPPSTYELWGENDRPRTLGTPSEVRAKIDRCLPGVDWSDPTWGVYDGEGFSFEFNMRHAPQVADFMVHVRGGGDAITTLLQFAAPNGWSLLDSATNEFIDPDDPSNAGWEEWQEARDQVIERYRAEESAPSLKRMLSAIWRRIAS